MSTLTKRQILDALGQIAFAAELLPETGLNGPAFSAAAWTLRSSEGEFDEMVESGELDKRRDIGKQVKEAVRALATDGAFAPLDEMKQQIPIGLFDVRKIKGLGPKKVRQLWQELGVTSVGELEYACNENRLVDLKGFGKKTQDKVVAGIETVRQFLGKRRLDHALALYATLQAAAADKAPDAQLHLSGALRRGQETVAGLRVVCTGTDGETLAALLDDAKVEDDTVTGTFDGFDVTLHLPDADQAMAAVLYFGAEPDFCARLVARAEELGFVYDKSGLFDGEDPVEAADVDEVFRALELVPAPPERWLDPVPLVVEGQAGPRLVRREDIAGALHNHTTASDGLHTLVQMRDAAAAAGLTYLGITEHSHTAAYAGGLDAGALAKQRQEVDALNQDHQGCPVLLGVESDILKDGALDYPDGVLQTLDVVIASVHQRYRATAEEMTDRMLAAVRHPLTDIIGHPTGRLLLGRAPSEFDVDAFLTACAETGTCVEHNSHPARLDLNETYMAQAKERGILISIAADAHSTEALSHLDYGITIARRAGLSPDDILNCRPLDALQQWIADRRAAAAA